MTSTLTLTYNKKIKGHSMSGLLVYEQFESLGSTLGASRTIFHSLLLISCLQVEMMKNSQIGELLLRMLAKVS